MWAACESQRVQWAQVPLSSHSTLTCETVLWACAAPSWKRCPDRLLLASWMLLLNSATWVSRWEAKFFGSNGEWVWEAGWSWGGKRGGKRGSDSLELSAIQAMWLVDLFNGPLPQYSSIVGLTAGEKNPTSLLVLEYLNDTIDCGTKLYPSTGSFTQASGHKRSGQLCVI